MDLLPYLRQYDPRELVYVSENTYCTRTHDSLKISNGKWCWFSRGIGGRSALDYLIKVKGIPFTEAVGMILGRAAEMPPVSHIQGDSHQPKEKNLLLPEPVEGSPEWVIAYLTSRGIDRPLLEACKAIQNSEPVPLGQYRGFEMELCFDPMFREYKITLVGSLRHQVFLGSDVYGNIQRLDNALEGLPASLAKTQEAVKSAQQNLEQAKAELNKPFPFEEELAAKSTRLGELNAVLDMDKPENDIVDDRDEDVSEPEKGHNLKR